MTLVGQKAPEFNSMAYHDGKSKRVSLKDYKGKWVVLFFYPLDFTFVCPTEIKGFARSEGEFKKLNAVVVGASTDSEHSHKAWIERDMPEVKFPILADTNHHVARSFGVLKEDQGIAYRGTFIIDPEGFIRFETATDLDVGRSVKETLRVLQAFQTGGLCEVDWTPGMENLNKKKK
jgi:alkyl hydroperoxide reductase subunit AhpC